MPTKDRNRAKKEAIRRMEKRVKVLQANARLLEEEHEALAATHATLQHAGQLLAWMLEQQRRTPEQLALHRDTVAAAQELLQEDCQGQLPCNPSSHFASVSLITGSEGSSCADELMVPPGNPLQMLYPALLQPPYCPGSLTVEQFLQDYAADVREIAMQLHKIDALQPMQLQGWSPAARLKAVVQRRCWIISSLVMQRQSALLSTSVLTDFETGAQLSQPDEQRHSWALSQLGLSQQQLQHMARAFGVYRRLLTPVLDEVRQLQQDIGGSSASTSGASSSFCGSDDGEPSQMSGGSACSGDGTEAAIRQRMAAAELEQQKTKRLHQLMHKDYLIKMCLAAHLYGCLTWSQFGRLLVVMSPHSPSAAALDMVVARLAGQQQQQQ